MMMILTEQTEDVQVIHGLVIDELITYVPIYTTKLQFRLLVYCSTKLADGWCFHQMSSGLIIIASRLFRFKLADRIPKQ